MRITLKQNESGERDHGERGRSRLGRSMPKQRPGLSVQNVGTPWEFIDAVEERFGGLTIDLASDEVNTKAPMWISEERNSFRVKWARNYEGNFWLNPPFGDIKPWAAKCAREAKELRYSQRKLTSLNGASLPWRKYKEMDRILLLVPASVGSNWFADFVWDKALVLFLRPRLKFVGHETHFPKDLLLAVYGEEPRTALWKWK